MPLIRKKTSKRGTTHQRVKIKHKVAESRKKSKKEAKKNTQWKSKHKKDPGIPNNFPYKDQILAEVADQRRQDEEERQRRKELRKAEKAAAKAGGVENDQDQDDASDFDGISSVATSTLKATARTSSAKGKERTVAAVEDDDDAPILLNSEYTDLKSVLDKADMMLHSKYLLQYLGEKGHGKTVLVLNKIDTCPRETVQAWAKLLRKQHTTCLFRSASAFLPQTDEQLKSTTAKAEAQSTSDALGAGALLRAFAAEASKKTDGPLLVAIVGIGNSGKSSLLNSLLRKSVSPVYKLSSIPSGPSTTERPLEVALEHDGKQIHLIDTPALAWERPSDLDGDAAAKLRAQDMLLRNKGRIERAKDPLTPGTYSAPARFAHPVRFVTSSSDTQQTQWPTSSRARARRTSCSSTRCPPGS
ncbi:GNL3L/Grn1 putative GTPase-domain-containing protein [Phellopilus nigrolimitatus]|nr:GNL3L/Grn1 putative GTPase-domain-containing protein [Phellopilus nigrolimitatus]